MGVTEMKNSYIVFSDTYNIKKCSMREHWRDRVKSEFCVSFNE